MIDIIKRWIEKRIYDANKILVEKIRYPNKNTIPLWSEPQRIYVNILKP
mgnify:CR=1 FL=1